MKEAIERVIAELEARRSANESAAEICRRNGDKYMEGVNSGRGMAYQAAAHRLRVVLANGENDHSGIPGTDSEETK